jgi:small subunit ribosomal protein S16
MTVVRRRSPPRQYISIVREDVMATSRQRPQDATTCRSGGSMALKIRLRRMGRKNAPTYRIVVAESSMPRDGRIVASIGHYNPRTEPLTLVVDRSKALHWLESGARPTETAKALLKRAGIFRPEEESVVVEAAEAVVEGAKKAGGAAKGAAGKVVEAAKAVGGAVGGAAGGVAEAVAEKAADVIDAVSERTADAAEVASEKAEEVIGAASDAVAGVAEEIPDAAAVAESVEGGEENAPADETESKE